MEAADSSERAVTLYRTVKDFGLLLQHSHGFQSPLPTYTMYHPTGAKATPSTKE
jgi:hypothetical protein